jgi:hypothetical protein
VDGLTRFPTLVCSAGNLTPPVLFQKLQRRAQLLDNPDMDFVPWSGLLKGGSKRTRSISQVWLEEDAVASPAFTDGPFSDETMVTTQNTEVRCIRPGDFSVIEGDSGCGVPLHCPFVLLPPHFLSRPEMPSRVAVVFVASRFTRSRSASRDKCSVSKQAAAKGS